MPPDTLPKTLPERAPDLAHDLAHALSGPAPLDLPPVKILMASFQGLGHLPQQLASFEAQRGVEWQLWVSDDGSVDGTLDCLNQFSETRIRAGHPGVTLLHGPRQGAAANFMSLLCHPDLPPGWVALSDQDDIWYPDKLRTALTALQGIKGPAVYSARSRHITRGGTPLGPSRGFAGQPGFGNALVENRVSGHAAVLNPQALALLRAVGPVRVPFHDWWIYQLITGAGGVVICDPRVMLDYRQHGDNVLGAPRGVLALVQRMRFVLSPEGQAMRSTNRRALDSARPHLHPQALTLLEALDRAPALGPGRMRALSRLGIRRSGAAAQLFLMFAALLGRF